MLRAPRRAILLAPYGLNYTQMILSIYGGNRRQTMYKPLFLKVEQIDICMYKNSRFNRLEICYAKPLIIILKVCLVGHLCLKVTRSQPASLFRRLNNSSFVYVNEARLSSKHYEAPVTNFSQGSRSSFL